MFLHGYILDSDDKLTAAQHNQQPVEFYKAGIRQHSGEIDSYNDDTVHINGGAFLRDILVFKIR